MFGHLPAFFMQHRPKYTSPCCVSMITSRQELNNQSSLVVTVSAWLYSWIVDILLENKYFFQVLHMYPKFIRNFCPQKPVYYSW